ncbi:hypothetical protein CLPU_1c00340 [Gottschalkia purinilytica]|uniref:Zinc-ribbon 15 domain-containing protein n=1 Tax=Gottschalkia purinilytica TaxID=1503 RepID=A0A0L0WEH6_GOTPU|nr:zinc ribbon domain-containing protein [Gottschalkia purinilytica]KNF09869.1 hypothetical protein CLPU_1c00340 [Gottschalkia purinilytica]
MFFIGIFGIEEKEKIVKELDKLECKNCNDHKSAYLIKSYRYFHFFFIPIFKWNIKYYVTCNNCNSLYMIDEEKGRKAEKGEIDITYWDLQEVETNREDIQMKCPSCSSNLNDSYIYCPYCGNKIK